jgi:hypothetical protein
MTQEIHPPSPTPVMPLVRIQEILKAPKNQTNSFGGYSYRSAEDILSAVKNAINELGLHVALILSDEIAGAGDRCYVKATAALVDASGTIIASTTAFARETETKKGMDPAQITGSASSYARKYALNGLFAIDDVKDADSMDNTESTTTTAGDGFDL